MRQHTIGVDRLIHHKFCFLSRYDTVIPLSCFTFIFATFDVLFYSIAFQCIHDVLFILRLIVFNSTMLQTNLI